MDDIDPSFQKLYASARYLRDHMLQLSGHDAVALSAALRPIEKTTQFSDVTDDQIAALNSAFQAAYDSAAEEIDGRTLRNIVIGKSPHIHTDSTLASVGLAIIGLVLVVCTFHFTLWSNRTQSLVSQAENFISFDHNAQMMKVIELEALFSAQRTAPVNNPVDTSSTDIDSELVYLEQRALLELHYEFEKTLPADLMEHFDGFNPVTQIKMDFIRSICRMDQLDESSVLRLVAGCKTRIGATVIQRPLVTTQSNTRNPKALETYGIGFQQKVVRFEAIQNATMRASGRTIGSPYTLSYRIIETMRIKLLGQLSIVRLWALPILYGALGSVVYCMWRVLDTRVSGLGLTFSVMRTGFAGLAALTFSMLLIPANVLSIGAEMNRPIIYLLSFIFGYSIEAFISTLNVINSYVMSNIAVKPRKA